MRKMKQKPSPRLIGRYDYVFPKERCGSAGQGIPMAKWMDEDFTGIRYLKHFFKFKNRRIS